MALYDPAHHRHPKHYIWRLETEDGTGIYNHPPAKAAMYRISDEGRNYYEHPNPFDEYEREAPGEGYSLNLDPYSCGFHSIEQARRWFFGEADGNVFDDVGIYLTAYPRDMDMAAKEFHMQTIFRKPKRGTHVARFSPAMLWELNAETLHDMAFYEIEDLKKAEQKAAASL